MGLMWSPVVVIIYEYFDKYKSLASGMTLAGQSVGMIVVGPVCRLLIDHYGWRGAMIILAGITLQGCITAAIMAPFQQIQSQQPRSWKQSLNIKILRNCNFGFFALSYSQAGFLYSSMMVLSPSRAVTKGKLCLFNDYKQLGPKTSACNIIEVRLGLLIEE